MIYIITDELTIFEDYFLSFGHSNDHSVIGLCLFNKYCWTNIFGFEILKEDENEH